MCCVFFQIFISVHLLKYSGPLCVDEKLTVIGNLRACCVVLCRGRYVDNGETNRCSRSCRRSVGRDRVSRLLFYPTRFRINFSVLYAHRTGRAKIVKKKQTVTRLQTNRRHTLALPPLSPACPPQSCAATGRVHPNHRRFSGGSYTRWC